MAYVLIPILELQQKDDRMTTNAKEKEFLRKYVLWKKTDRMTFRISQNKDFFTSR